jgi:hypothetical protein
MLGFTRKEVIGGVKLWEKRDHVACASEFLHMHDKYNLGQQGAFP